MDQGMPHHDYWPEDEEEPNDPPLSYDYMDGKELPNFDVLNGAADRERDLLLSEILRYQEQDCICYLEYQDDEGTKSAAHMICPIDSRETIEALLLSYQPEQCVDLQVVTKWPTMVVVRGRTFKQDPPTAIDHFVYSKRAHFTESLHDLLGAIEEHADLHQQEANIVKRILANHSIFPASLQEIRSLIFDLLCQGGDFMRLATYCIHDCMTKYRAQIEKIFPADELKEARAIGEYRTHALHFYQNTLIHPSHIKDWADLQFIMEREDVGMHEELYCAYLGSLRPTTRCHCADCCSSALC
jgi:hypothetical protein